MNGYLHVKVISVFHKEILYLYVPYKYLSDNDTAFC